MLRKLLEAYISYQNMLSLDDSFRGKFGAFVTFCGSEKIAVYYVCNRDNIETG